MTTSASQQHSIVSTDTPIKRKLKDSSAVQELKLKVQELKATIKNEKANIKKQSLVKKPKLIKGKSKKRKTDSKVGFRSKSQTVVKKECRRNISFDSSSSEDENTSKMICQDDELDGPKSFSKKGAARSEEPGSNDIIAYCVGNSVDTKSFGSGAVYVLGGCTRPAVLQHLQKILSVTVAKTIKQFQICKVCS